jgi:hypothetical protein
MPWSTPFDEPIRLRGGGSLITLQHAADYIMKLPHDVQQQPHWQISVENLINAAETGGGWLMFARIGMMRALNRYVDRVFNTSREDHRWGNRSWHGINNGSRQSSWRRC